MEWKSVGRMQESFKKWFLMPGVVVHTSNPCTQYAEAGGSLKKGKKKVFFSKCWFNFYLNYFLYTFCFSTHVQSWGRHWFQQVVDFDE
jgi:hypothetical protein